MSRGALIRSGKPTGFCAGADLPEIWAAFDTILATPKPRRFAAAYDHFFRLSVGAAGAGDLRQAGRGGHRRTGARRRRRTCARRALPRADATTRRAAIGLPESLVGLLPGAGGTQRLPRLVGVEAAMPALLDGKRFSGEAAVAAGVAHRVVRAGEEIAAAEAWLLSAPGRCSRGTATTGRRFRRRTSARRWRRSGARRCNRRSVTIPPCSPSSIAWSSGCRKASKAASAARWRASSISCCGRSRAR